MLKVISRSTFDLQAVLDTLVESAARLCEADMAYIWRPSGDGYRHVASLRHVAPNSKSTWRVIRFAVRARIDRRPDLAGRQDHSCSAMCRPIQNTGCRRQQRIGGYRTMLGVPLLREGMPIGVIVLHAHRVCGRSPRSRSSWSTTFADQAVIAIENVRLFDEVQARTRELSEALEQQTATSEVLQVITSSPGELEPVFQAMLENATRICEANSARCCFAKRDAFRVVALHNAPPAYAEHRQREPLVRPPPEPLSG